MVRFGRTVERGFLPVYGVETEEQAHHLLVSTCPRNLRGEFIATELAEEQTLENLAAFGERLHARAIELGFTKTKAQMYNRNTLWNNAEDARLIKLFNARKLTLHQIADKMGRSWHSVRSRLQRLRGQKRVGFRDGSEPLYAHEAEGY